MSILKRLRYSPRPRLLGLDPIYIIIDSPSVKASGWKKHKYVVT